MVLATLQIVLKGEPLLTGTRHAEELESEAHARRNYEVRQPAADL